MESTPLDFTRAAELVGRKHSGVKLITRTVEITLPPFYVGRVKLGIKEHLNSKLCHYDSNLDGVLLAYDKLYLTSRNGKIVFDGSCIDVEIQADYVLFYPEVGKKLKGVVNKYGKDYVGCLVHETFNASMPRPSDEESWLGDQLNIGDEIVFRVTFVIVNGKFLSLKGSILKISKRNSDISKSTNGFDETELNGTTDLNDGSMMNGTVESNDGSMMNGTVESNDESTHKKHKKHKKKKAKEEEREGKKRKMDNPNENEPKKKRKK